MPEAHAPGTVGEAPTGGHVMVGGKAWFCAALATVCAAGAEGATTDYSMSNDSSLTPSLEFLGRIGGTPDGTWVKAEGFVGDVSVGVEGEPRFGVGVGINGIGMTPDGPETLRLTFSVPVTLQLLDIDQPVQGDHWLRITNLDTAAFAEFLTKPDWDLTGLNLSGVASQLGEGRRFAITAPPTLPVGGMGFWVESVEAVVIPTPAAATLGIALMGLGVWRRRGTRLWGGA